MLLQAQTPLAAAQDGLFPGFFARRDRRGTPWLGLLLSSVLTSALIGTNYSQSLVALFTFAILLATAASLLPYAVSVLAWWRIDASARRSHKLIAAGALIYSLWALLGTGAVTLLWGAALLLAGLPLLLWQRRRAATAIRH